jgi:hypothetical protein
VPPVPNLTSDDRIEGFKAISKRVVTKGPATGLKKIKVLWSLDTGIWYDALDNTIGDMNLWGWRVAEDWDAQEYDTQLRAQQAYKKQERNIGS